MKLMTHILGATALACLCAAATVQAENRIN